MFSDLFHFKLGKALVLLMVGFLVSCGSGSGSSSSKSKGGSMSASQLLKQVNLNKDYIPYGRHARKYRRRMTPRYITIHSTQNYSPTADAWQHSKALKNGKLRATKRKGGNRIGYLVWHYSIDQDRVVQHLPDNEQGEHADFDGPGNNYSLGLEMCENRGNSRNATIERTAKLTAYLMKRHGISIKNVVPHYHWPRTGLSKPHKNCPHYLLDNGRPGAKWRAFQAKIMRYYKQISGSSATATAPAPVSRPYYSAPTAPVSRPYYSAPTAPTSRPYYSAPTAPASRPYYSAPAPTQRSNYPTYPLTPYGSYPYRY